MFVCASHAYALNDISILILLFSAEIQFSLHIISGLHSSGTNTHTHTFTHTLPPTHPSFIVSCVCLEDKTAEIMIKTSSFLKTQTFSLHR